MAVSQTPAPIRIDRFWIRDVLATHSHGVTYTASDSRRARQPRWVLKPIPWEEEGLLRKKLRTDLLDLASLRHPGLALASSFVRDFDSRRAFAVRPYVPGPSFSELRGRPFQDLLSWFTAAAEALGILHRHGFLHRNLKASNFRAPGADHPRRAAKSQRVVLCDPALEGEAVESGPNRRSNGSRGSAMTSFESDLFDLGTVFYELLGGRGLKVDEAGFPQPLVELNQAIPRDLDRIIRRLLHPEPGGRYQEVRVLVSDLRLLCGDQTAPPCPLPDCFLGRGSELRRAKRSLEDRTRPFFLAVAGEAGIGKTAFLERLALEAQVAGYRTVQANCFPERVVPHAALRAIAEDLVALGSRALEARSRRLLSSPPSPTGAAPGRMEHRVFLRELLDLYLEASATGPTLILLDDAHLADSTTVELIIKLAEAIAGFVRLGNPSLRQPPSLTIAYRTETPYRAALGPLLGALRSLGDGHRAIDLPALPPEEVEKWLEVGLAGQAVPLDQLKLPARQQGNPFAIRFALREALRIRTPAARTSRGTRLSAIFGDWFSSLDESESNLLAAIALLGKPAPPDLLGRLPGLSVPGVRAGLERLVLEGTLLEERGRYFFRHRSFQDSVLDALPEPRRKVLHGSLAAALGDHPHGSVEEVAHHRLLSERPDADREVILTAARQLAAGNEFRRALGFYQAFLERLPPSEVELRQVASMELAEVHGQVGDYRRAAEILEGLLPVMEGTLGGSRIHGRIGVFHHRAGSPERGAFHLKKGLALLEGASGVEWFRERLRMISELAEMASNRNQLSEAEALCSQALEEISRRGEMSSDPEVRRQRMILLETLAHLRLRQFRYEEAQALFEKSLSLSEELEAGSEASLILNNLGILHIQQNRFPDAILCYRRAEEIAARLGEDHTLANIHSNLAVLYAKTGEPEAADLALRNAEMREAACDSERVRFLRLHSSGLVDLTLGRYGSAIENFRASIALGDEIKDRFVAAFDLIYLGECHLFRGEYRPAGSALRRAVVLGGDGSGAVGRMAAARTASLAALRGDFRGARATAESYASNRGDEGKIPFLGAWDNFFLGWSRRLIAEPERAEEALNAALSFFSAAGLPGGEIHCHLELAALELDGGATAKASKRLSSLRSRFTCGRGPLANPMLCSRLLAYQARALLEARSTDPERAVQLLVEAESYLIGRQLRDLEVLVGRLRARAGTGRRGRAAPSPAHGPAEESSPVARSGCGDGQMAGNSPAMLEVLSSIRRLGPSRLPVLITGETGTGKDLVARAIHGESTRRFSPLISINCAALPEQLLEAELFGYRRGAFSGAEEDRDGLLQKAHGGTFFFDEIGELPSSLQGKILRVLDSSTLRPVGAESEIRIDTRFLFATNQDLRALVKEKRFRQDLFFRLAVLEIRVPPLRERIEDLPLLIQHFQGLSGTGKAPLLFEESALGLLTAYTWPGNVRELRNVILRLSLDRKEMVTAGDVKILLREQPPGGLFPPTVLRSRHLDQLFAELEREYLVLLHEDKGGDLKAMADCLGVTERALYKRFKLLGIKPGRLRKR